MDRTKIIALNLIFFFGLPAFSSAQPCDLGKNYAVFFGVADYDSNSGWPDLGYPVKDIESIASLLYDHYAFDTLLLRNPSKTEIWDELYELKQKKWSEHDQLLIFFSGHGESGYFIPRDGRKDREEATAISFDDKFQDFLNDILCEHQLVVIDACYSGSFFTVKDRNGGNGDHWKNALIEEEQDKNLQILCSHWSRKSRLAMTSAESLSPDRSELARAFRNLLVDRKDQDEILYSAAIYLELIKEASTPIFDKFHDANDLASSFVFIPEKVRREYEESEQCPIDPADCTIKKKICAECPEDRDNQSYEVQLVNGKLWMKENLKFSNDGRSFCQNCEVFGRLYTWEQANAACKALDGGSGWRLPTIKEWEELTLKIGGGYSRPGIGSSGEGNAKAAFPKLMAPDSKWTPQLGGYKDGKRYQDQGKEGLYWSSSETNGGFDAQVFSFSSFGVFEITKPKNVALSCRCVRD